MLKLSSEGFWLWKTEGTWSQHVIAEIPYRYYIQTNLNHPARLVYESIHQAGRERPVIGASPNGSLLWLADGYVYGGVHVGRLDVPRYSVKLADDDLRPLTVTNAKPAHGLFRGDAIGAWPVRLSIADTRTVSTQIEREMHRIMSDGAVSREQFVSGEKTEVTITLEAEIQFQTARPERYARTVLTFSAIRPYVKYPRWKDVVAAHHLTESDVKMIWPVATISDAGFTIWNGKTWTNILWTTKGAFEKQPNIVPEDTTRKLADPQH